MYCQLFAGGDRGAGDLDGSSLQFAFFEEGPGGTEEHPEEVQADRGGEMPRQGQDLPRYASGMPSSLHVREEHLFLRVPQNDSVTVKSWEELL